MLEASFEAVQPLATLILPTTQPCVSLSVCMSTHYPPLHYSLLTAHYSRHDSRLTTHDALQASYEAVLLCAALDQAEGQGSGLAVLTFLGGGVFGNKAEWIEEAIARAVVRLHHLSLATLLNLLNLLNVLCLLYLLGAAPPPGPARGALPLRRSRPEGSDAARGGHRCRAQQVSLIGASLLAVLPRPSTIHTHASVDSSGRGALATFVRLKSTLYPHTSHARSSRLFRNPEREISSNFRLVALWLWQERQAPGSVGRVSPSRATDGRREARP